MMYSFSVTNQLYVFADSFAFGFLLSFMYQVIFFAVGIFTLKIRLRHIVSDIIFSVFLPALFFCFILSFNLGAVRFYLVSGIFFGVLIYHLSFAYPVNFIGEKLIACMRRPVLLLLDLLKTVFLKFQAAIKAKPKKNKKKTKKYIANKKKSVV